MRYWLHPEAESDLRDAAEFYQKRADSSLSKSLLAEFERCVDLLQEHPNLGTLWRNGRRRLLMKRFPYSVVYTIIGEQIRILAIAHQNRRPGYWRRRR